MVPGAGGGIHTGGNTVIGIKKEPPDAVQTVKKSARLSEAVGRDPCVPPRKGMWIPLASLCEGGGSAKRWRRERFHTVFSPPVGCADSPLPEGASQRGTAAGSSPTPVYRRRSPQETGCAARRRYGVPRGGSPPRCSRGWSWRRCRCARRWSGRGSACRRARSSCSG